MGLAWAMAGGSDKPVAAMFDALRGEVFAAIYSFGATDVTVHTAPRRIEVGQLLGVSSVTPGLAVGDGTVGHEDLIRKWTGRNPVVPPRGTPFAHHLLGLACLRGALTAVPALDAFEPNYGRVAEAQARWETAHGRPLHDPPG
jgi:tRNA A37 threonylcarbamoyladenosine modification protein TsaB